MTQQSFKDDADINVIVRRFGVTGQLPQDVRVPRYGDFTAAMDFHESMNLILEAQRAFMEMPSEVRSRFNNDPGSFVDFVSDPKNQDEARKLGIADPLPEPSTAVQGATAAAAAGTPTPDVKS